MAIIVIPTFDTLLANASAWVDFQIKPLLACFPWIIPDSKTFCWDILNIRIPAGKEIWLVSDDVVAMYPNIPIEDGITQIATILVYDIWHSWRSSWIRYQFTGWAGSAAPPLSCSQKELCVFWWVNLSSDSGDCYGNCCCTYLCKPIFCWLWGLCIKGIQNCSVILWSFHW